MDRQVTVYTTPTCSHCQQVKSFLTELGVQYKEIDVSADPEAAMDIVRRTNQYSVPGHRRRWSACHRLRSIAFGETAPYPLRVMRTKSSPSRS